MRMSSEMRFPSVSPQARAWETPIYSNDSRFQSGGALGGMPSMPTFSYPVSTTGSLSMGGSMSGRPLTSMPAAQSNFPIRAGCCMPSRIQSCPAPPYFYVCRNMQALTGVHVNSARGRAHATSGQKRDGMLTEARQMCTWLAVRIATRKSSVELNWVATP